MGRWDWRVKTQKPCWSYVGASWAAALQHGGLPCQCTQVPVSRDAFGHTCAVEVVYMHMHT